MTESVNERVRRRRAALRAAGLRPLQLWVPDVRQPGFTAACRRQSQRVATADAADSNLQDFMDAALADLEPPAE